MATKVDSSSASASTGVFSFSALAARFTAFKDKVVSTLKSVFHLQKTPAKPIGQRGVEVGSPPKKSPLKQLTHADLVKGREQAQPSLLKKDMGIHDIPGLTSDPAFKSVVNDMEKVFGNDLLSTDEKRAAFTNDIAPKLNQALKEAKLSYSEKFGLHAANGKAFAESLKTHLLKDVLDSKKDWFEAEWKQVFDGKGTSEFYHNAVIGLGETGTGDFRNKGAALEGTSIQIGEKTYVFKEKIGSGAFGVTANYVRSPKELDEEKKKGIKSTGPMELAIKVPQHDPKEPEHVSFIDSPVAEGQVNIDAVGTGASADHVVNTQGFVRTTDGLVLIILGVAHNGSLKGFSDKLKDAVEEGRLGHSTAAKFKKGVARDILHGLQRLHKGAWVLHLDLAGRNILLNRLLRAQVADFGLAKKQQGADFAHAKVGDTGDKMPIRWTAPERLRGEDATSKADIWSFGATLLELATGKEPFHQETSLNELIKEVAQPGFDVTPYLEGLADGDFSEEEAEQLSNLLKKIFSANPADRPTIEEILADPFFAVDEAEIEEARDEVLNELGVKPAADEKSGSDGYGVPIPVAYREVRLPPPANGASPLDDGYGNEMPVVEDMGYTVTNEGTGVVDIGYVTTTDSPAVDDLGYVATVENPTNDPQQQPATNTIPGPVPPPPQTRRGTV